MILRESRKKLSLLQGVLVAGTSTHRRSIAGVFQEMQAQMATKTFSPARALPDGSFGVVPYSLSLPKRPYVQQHIAAERELQMKTSGLFFDFRGKLGRKKEKGRRCEKALSGYCNAVQEMRPQIARALAGGSFGTVSLSPNLPTKQHVADRLAEFGETIFTTMSELALKHSAVNLGQGFPSFDGPDFIKEAAVEAIRSGKGQYARLQGVPALNAAIADRFEKDYHLKVDPDAEVTVTCGCTGAISAAFFGLINPGDEVVLIEPYYDSYRACAAMVGAKVKYVTLRPPSFAIVEEELRAAFSSKTRAIIINSPHNPTGRVFSRKEMELVASLCQEHDALVLTDQVYEKIVFPGTGFVAMATLPGMYERTVSMSSMGKTFSLTGWKIGWAIAPPPLTDAIRRAHQFLTFAIATPLQWATVTALRAPDEFFEQLVDQYTARRDKLVAGLKEVGFRVFEPEGSFFVMADYTPFRVADDDVSFCKYLIEHVGVVAIPPSCFYSDPNEGKHLVRFAFCKDDDVLSEAISRMKAKLPAPVQL